MGRSQKRWCSGRHQAHTHRSPTDMKANQQNVIKKTPNADKSSHSRSGSPRANLTLPGIRQSPRNISPLVHDGKASSPRSGTKSPTVIPESPLSPFASTLSPLPDKLSGSKSLEAKKKGGKVVCPCGKSSAGKDWNLKCCSCKQVWHTSCANLKGANDLSKPQVDTIMVHWQCPWCFQCPFSPPESHITVKNRKALHDSTVSCSVLQQISESVTDIVSKTLPGSLSNQINQLSQQVQDLSNKPSSVEMRSESEPPKVHLVSPEPPYGQYLENFLDSELLEQTMSFLSEQVEQNRFKPENGHSVLSFGESYTYVGSKSSAVTEPIPQVLESIIQTFDSKLNLKSTPNSVLINYYPSTGSNSYLPYHSDDEPTIQPDSKIVTISLGGSRSINFKAIHNDTEEIKTLTPEHNSVYTMTRSSQGWFKHGIDSTESPEVRFSLTFRCVNQRNRRSVILQGDSNTKNIKFGRGAGTVGETYPGKRQKAAKVSDINPESCVGYSNIVLVCGTNNLRVNAVRDDSDISKVVDVYRNKLRMIKQLAPASKIFVVPVLPTRNARMNRNITRFNCLLSEMLSTCFRDIYFPGVYSFLDSKNLLSNRLTRENDDIHLGEKGIAQFVRLLKLWIFECDARERRLGRNSSRAPQKADPAGST